MTRANRRLESMIRVVVVEDRRELRDGLSVLIDGTEGYRCVRSYGSMEEALAGIAPRAAACATDRGPRGPTALLDRVVRAGLASSGNQISGFSRFRAIRRSR